MLANAYHYFPKKTVHIIGINTLFHEGSRYVAMMYNDHFFVGADNGIFSLLLNGEKPQELVELNLIQDLRYLHFPLADILTKSACHIAKGGKLTDIGNTIDQTVEKVTLQPIYDNDTIRGNVVYVDAFGNAITNISKELFNRVQKGRSFTFCYLIIIP